MRKGFTMIELIFVIVILGILAAVAIPRLSATRDDAEISKIATNLSTLISDIGGYYTSQGDFGKLAQMTNVVIDTPVDFSDTSNKATGNLKAAGKKCLQFELYREVNSETKKTPAYFALAAGAEASQPICAKIVNDPEVKKIIDSEFVGQTGTKGSGDKVTWAADAQPTKGIQITGLSVVR